MTPVEQLVKAWCDAGPVPEYHYAHMDRLRREWPMLARAIEAVVEEAEDK